MPVLIEMLASALLQSIKCGFETHYMPNKKGCQGTWVGWIQICWNKCPGGDDQRLSTELRTGEGVGHAPLFRRARGLTCPSTSG